MRNELDGKNILVTGGTGSIGSCIVEELLNYKIKKVVIFSRDETKHFLLKSRYEDTRVEAIVGDIRDYRCVERIFEKYTIDLIFHAAAMKHVSVSENFPIECALTNVIGTQNIVDLAKKYKVPKFVTISTDKATTPSNVMGATKLIAEKITLNANFTCVRFGNVANSRGSVIPVFVDNLKNRKPIVVTDPNVTRFILQIPDAVRLVIKATKYAQGGEIFILKMKAFKLGELVEVLVDEIAPLLNIAKKDIEIRYTGLITGEKLHEDLINPAELNRIFELDDMYIVLKEKGNLSRYPGIESIILEKYSSNDTKRITKEEINKIISQYIYDSLPIRFNGKYNLGK